MVINRMIILMEVQNKCFYTCLCSRRSCYTGPCCNLNEIWRHILNVIKHELSHSCFPSFTWRGSRVWNLDIPRCNELTEESPACAVISVTQKKLGSARTHVPNLL